MGLDLHSLHLLRHAERSGADFSSVLTVGRLGLYLTEADLARLSAESNKSWTPAQLAELRRSGFCEAFLRAAFGAKEVTSLDASDYDGATLVHDLNQPLAVERTFTAVLDFGTLEHVFNVPVALASLIGACREDGHLLHVLPANNWCGHGFYQFSPEFFFSLYAEGRGFTGTEVFLVEEHQPRTWYRVRNPAHLRRRVQVVNRERTLVLVMTRKTSRAVMPTKSAPQQSDYVAQWKEKGSFEEAKPQRIRHPVLSAAATAIREPLRALRRYIFGHRQQLSRDRGDVEVLEVGSLYGRGGQ
jgi:SAM-dependent methyltransferase